MAAAAAGGGTSVRIFRAKYSSSARLLFIQQRDSSSASSTDIPLLQKLLESPLSSVKATLDSEFTSSSAEFPSAALLSSLHTSAPQKANLGIKPTSLVFNALISTSLSSGNLLTALSLFEIMEGSETYKPDSDTYNAFISAHASKGNKRETEAWFKSKISSGFPADAQTYGFLVHCCIKSRAFEDARRYFEEMLLERLLPDESVVQDVLMMCCKQRDSGKVGEILKFVSDCGWEVGRYTSKKVVDLYRELGLAEELEELLETLTKSSQSSEARSLVHSSLIRMYADRDRLDDVEYRVGRMVKNGASFASEEDVGKVICSYFRREAFDRLDMFLERIKHSYELTRSTYDLLGAGYRRAGLSEKVDLVVSEMKRAGFG